jgi:hypothetical protein
VKDRHKIHIITVDKIRYIESLDDYVMIYTNDGRHISGLDAVAPPFSVMTGPIHRDGNAAHEAAAAAGAVAVQSELRGAGD